MIKQVHHQKFIIKERMHDDSYKPLKEVEGRNVSMIDNELVSPSFFH